MAGVHPSVAALVYVAALAPDSGETTAQQYDGFATTPDFIIDVGEDGLGVVNREMFEVGFAADLMDAEVAFMRDAQVLINMAAFSATITHAAWRDKPSWAVFGTEDNAFDQTMLQHMAQRAGSESRTVAGSHAVFVSQAGVVADVVATAASRSLVGAV